MTGAPSPESLSREHSELLVELAVALHKSAIYPGGHPILQTAVTALARHLGEALETSGTISIGVARHQLVIEGVATNADHPHLRTLAQHLHDQQIGAMRFSRGIERDELASFLATVATDGIRRDTPLGVAGTAVLQQWTHAALFPMAFDQLELVRDVDAGDEASGESAQRDAKTRGGGLWVGLAQAALAGERGADAATVDPTIVAGAIDARAGDGAYDQVIVGYLVQIAREVARSEGKPSASLQQRISRLLGTMQSSSLRRLLDMGGDASQRKQFVLDASHGFAASAVVEVVKAAADVSGFHISSPLMRLLTKLAANADETTSPIRATADVELRHRVRSLLSNWDLTDPNPDAYNAALRQIAGAAHTASPATERASCEPDRLIEIALDVGVVGPSTVRACAELAAREGIAASLARIDSAPPSQAREALLDAVLTPELLRSALKGGTADQSLIDRVVVRAGARAVDALLDAIAALDTAPAGTITERETAPLVETLVRIGSPAVPRIGDRMRTMPTTALRVLFAVLERIGEWPAEIELTSFARHPDAHVRREAVKLLLKTPGTRDAGITIGVADPDERCVQQAIRAALTSCPPEAIRVLVGRADDPTLNPELRARATRVIANFANGEALAWVLDRLVKTHWFFRSRRLRETSPQLLAALAGLAARTNQNRDVAEVIALAAASRDPVIRAAVHRKAAA